MIFLVIFPTSSHKGVVPSSLPLISNQSHPLLLQTFSLSDNSRILHEESACMGLLLGSLHQFWNFLFPTFGQERFDWSHLSLWRFSRWRKLSMFLPIFSNLSGYLRFERWRCSSRLGIRRNLNNSLRFHFSHHYRCLQVDVLHGLETSKVEVFGFCFPLSP